MQKIPKPESTAAFKEQAVKRVKDGKTVGSVAKEMGLVEQTLRHWVKASDAGKLDGPGARKVTPEEMELSRLRAENVRQARGRHLRGCLETLAPSQSVCGERGLCRMNRDFDRSPLLIMGLRQNIQTSS